MALSNQKRWPLNMSVFPGFEPCFTLPGQREALDRRLAPRSTPVSCEELRRILAGEPLPADA